MLLAVKAFIVEDVVMMVCAIGVGKSVLEGWIYLLG